MPIKLRTPPAGEPLSLAEVKLHLRIDNSDEDLLLTMLISAARLHAENVTRRAFMTQTYDLYLDRFPRQNFYGVFPGYIPIDQYIPSVIQSERGYAIRFMGGKIELPFPPFETIALIEYLDTTGTMITMPSTAYALDGISEPAVLAPVPGTDWPQTLNTLNGVHIQYTAGYGDATTVPAGLKSWMLMRIGALYETREEAIIGQRITVAEMPFVDRLLDPYRIASI